MTASLYQRASLGSRPDSAKGSSVGVLSCMGALSGAGDLSVASDFASFICLRHLFDGYPSVQRLKIVVEILLGAHAPPQSEYVRRYAPRIEHDVVAPAAPVVTLIAQ